jgi:signal transduction histidine kinase
LSESVRFELFAALLQAVIILGLASLCGSLWLRYRKQYFLWWAIAWLCYAARVVAIVSFLVTRHRLWLYLVQVTAGLVALTLLWAAIVFARQRPWRWGYLSIAAIPIGWSYLATYHLAHVRIVGMLPALVQTVATLWTAIVFVRFSRRVGSRAAMLLAAVFVSWSVTLLFYPMLRSIGWWNPVGVYLNILFVVGVGLGTLLLVNEDLHRGLTALSALSGHLSVRRDASDQLDALLDRPLALAGVRGSALYVPDDDGGTFVRGRGSCVSWTETRPSAPARDVIEQSMRAYSSSVPTDVWPEVTPSRWGRPREPAYAAVLPLASQDGATGALVIVGEARDPFTALDESLLLAIGHQVGGALENASLYHRLESRTRELEHLSRRMVRQHEEERRRIGHELHDETAQLFASVMMRLKHVRDAAQRELAEQLDRIVALVDAGMRSIRNVASQLRPPLLDDLGLVPAMRALTSNFAEGGVKATFEQRGTVPEIGPDAELALFRALQEALSNVARHAGAKHVHVVLLGNHDTVELVVEDDGVGFPGFTERGGMTGMRERLSSVGGELRIARGSGGGARVVASVPLDDAGRDGR